MDADQTSVEVVATGEPTRINLRIKSTSTMVHGYVLEAPDAPGWLHVEGDQVQLLPGNEETVPIRLSARGSPPVMIKGSIDGGDKTTALVIA